MTKTKSYLWIANLCALIATIAINVLANVLPLGGYNTGQISAMYPTLFTPPGFTFGIWGAIYALLCIFIIISIFSKTVNDAQRIGPYFIITCVCNIAWIFTWHYQMIVLSFLAIAGLLVSLIKIYSITRESSFITKTAFSMYYAWISVATLIAMFVLVKTLTGGAPVTPIEPRAKVSAYTLEGSDWVPISNHNPEYDTQAGDDNTVSLDPPERPLPDIYGDIMLINETSDAIEIPADISESGVVESEVTILPADGSYEDTTDPRIIIVGGDPEIASYASSVEYLAATIVAFIVGVITIFHIYKFGDMVYAITILWAMGGIAYRQITAPKPPIFMLVVAALAIIAIICAMIDKSRKCKTCRIDSN